MGHMDECVEVVSKHEHMVNINKYLAIFDFNSVGAMECNVV